MEIKTNPKMNEQGLYATKAFKAGEVVFVLSGEVRI
jgi:hypothetical protein